MLTTRQRACRPIKEPRLLRIQGKRSPLVKGTIRGLDLGPLRPPWWRRPWRPKPGRPAWGHWLLRRGRAWWRAWPQVRDSNERVRQGPRRFLWHRRPTPPRAVVLPEALARSEPRAKAQRVELTSVPSLRRQLLAAEPTEVPRQEPRPSREPPVLPVEIGVDVLRLMPSARSTMEEVWVSV
jgi:hypothetical protein